MNLSNRIARSRPLATTAMHGQAEALRNAGERVIDLSIAISHFPAPGAVHDALKAALDGGRSMPYTDVGGALDVRQALCAKLRQENGIEANAGQIIVTNGCKQAYYEALVALTDPGDTIAVFRPYWPAYLTSAELLGLQVAMTDLPGVLTPATLAAFGQVRALVLNNPHNPSGKVFTRAELAHILDWAAASGAHLIVDESYEHLVFEGQHVSLAALRQARPEWRAVGVVTLFSSSQNYAMMGWRIGFAHAPEHVIGAMQTLQGPITAAAPYLSQVAAVAAFGSGARPTMMADYRLRRDLVLRHFADVPWITLHAPDSGPYLWGDVRALTHDTIGFAARLLAQERVALMPGDALGVPGFIRIGYIVDDQATLLEGVRRIIAFGNGIGNGAGKPLSVGAP
jgi:aspartate aminotransferase